MLECCNYLRLFCHYAVTFSGTLLETDSPPKHPPPPLRSLGLSIPHHSPLKFKFELRPLFIVFYFFYNFTFHFELRFWFSFLQFNLLHLVSPVQSPSAPRLSLSLSLRGFDHLGHPHTLTAPIWSQTKPSYPSSRSWSC